MEKGEADVVVVAFFIFFNIFYLTGCYLTDCDLADCRCCALHYYRPFRKLTPKDLVVKWCVCSTVVFVCLYW